MLGAMHAGEEDRVIPLEMDERTTAPDGRPQAEQPAWRRDFPIDAAAGAVRRPPRLHPLHDDDERGLRGRPSVPRRAELLPRHGPLGAAQADRPRRRNPRRRRAAVSLPGRERPLLAAAAGRANLPRLQPEMHPSGLRRHAGRGDESSSSAPATRACSTRRRADRWPGRRAGRCRASPWRIATACSTPSESRKRRFDFWIRRIRCDRPTRANSA